MLYNCVVTYAFFLYGPVIGAASLEKNILSLLPGDINLQANKTFSSPQINNAVIIRVILF